MLFCVMDTPKTFVVLAPSARGFRNCLLGEGATAREAWMDAYGVPRKPRHARDAWLEEVTWEELVALQDARQY